MHESFKHLRMSTNICFSFVNFFVDVFYVSHIFIVFKRMGDNYKILISFNHNLLIKTSFNCLDSNLQPK